MDEDQLVINNRNLKKSLSDLRIKDNLQISVICEFKDVEGQEIESITQTIYIQIIQNPDIEPTYITKLLKKGVPVSINIINLNIEAYCFIFK